MLIVQMYWGQIYKWDMMMIDEWKKWHDEWQLTGKEIRKFDFQSVDIEQ